MSEKSFLESDYCKIINNSNLNVSNETITQIINDTLKHLKLNSDAVLDEKNIELIRQYISSITMDPNAYGADSFNDYLAAIMVLTCFAEYYSQRLLQQKYNSLHTTRNLKEDSLIIGYYFSRENKTALQKLGYKNFSDAFSSISKIMHQKLTTLKNMRDEFDPYFDNGRKGWYQRPLSASRKAVFDCLQNVSEDELTKIVKEIIAYYKKADEEQNDEEKGRKKIIVASKNMKEIKSKKI